MSEYYLADTKAAERARQRQREREPKQDKPKADIKVTLLGDFLFASSDPQGCDPYNSLHGQSAREAWRTRRERS